MADAKKYTNHYETWKVPPTINSLTIKSHKNPSNKIVNKHKADKQDCKKKKTQKSKLKEKVESLEKKEFTMQVATNIET